MNPLMGNAGGVQINPQAIQQAKQMMKAFQMAANPRQAVMQSARQNPMLNMALQMCQGKDPKEVFYSMCQQAGVNPDDVLNQLR